MAYHEEQIAEIFSDNLGIKKGQNQGSRHFYNFKYFSNFSDTLKKKNT